MFPSLYNVLFIYSIQDIKELVRSDSFSSPLRVLIYLRRNEKIRIYRRNVFVPSAGFLFIFLYLYLTPQKTTVFSSPLRGSFLSTCKPLPVTIAHFWFSSPQRGSFLSTINMNNSLLELLEFSPPQRGSFLSTSTSKNQ